MTRDRAASQRHGQLVLKTLHLGDFFVRNDEDSADDLTRVLEIVLQRRVVRPTRDERGMYAAWGASLRSSCLSRQVGAAILDEQGEILSAGTNEVPKFGGGLYQDGDPLDNDHRCHLWTKQGSIEPQCHNDATKHQIYHDVFKQLEGLFTTGATEDQVRERIEQTRIRDLIEFSRAVHAEMDALLGLARKGGASCIGASLYATTYPCHSCARHIVAAGIREVIYIEPYTKSMAAELHEDTIHEPTEAGPANIANARKVSFRLFSGVAPRRFANLFEKRSDLKDSHGRLLTPVTAGHQDPVFTQTFLDFERNIADRIAQQLEAEKKSNA